MRHQTGFARQSEDCLALYLALTLSTLLSSQVSGASRALRLGLKGLGQLDQLYSVSSGLSTWRFGPDHRVELCFALIFAVTSESQPYSVRPFRANRAGFQKRCRRSGDSTNVTGCHPPGQTGLEAHVELCPSPPGTPWGRSKTGLETLSGFSLNAHSSRD